MIFIGEQNFALCAIAARVLRIIWEESASGSSTLWSSMIGCAARVVYSRSWDGMVVWTGPRLKRHHSATMALRWGQAGKLCYAYYWHVSWAKNIDNFIYTNNVKGCKLLNSVKVLYIRIAHQCGLRDSDRLQFWATGRFLCSRRLVIWRQLSNFHLPHLTLQLLNAYQVDSSVST